MHVLVLRADLHLPVAQSLKAKRSAVAPIVRHLDQMAGVAAAETGYLDKWQRAEVGVSAVGGGSNHVEQIMDAVERYLWSRHEVEVLELERSWWTED